MSGNLTTRSKESALVIDIASMTPKLQILRESNSAQHKLQLKIKRQLPNYSSAKLSNLNSSSRFQSITNNETENKNSSTQRCPSPKTQILSHSLQRSYSALSVKIIDQWIQQNQTDKIHSINIQDIVQLYYTKCEDMKVEATQLQLEKFVSRFSEITKKHNLNLEEQGLGQCSLPILCKILNKNEQFSKLNLAKNILQDDGIIALVPILLTNKSLIHLNLQNNDIGDIGCATIFKMLLNQDQFIISLDISSPIGENRNHISTFSSRILSEVLSKNQVLQFLNIGSCSIGCKGLYIICKGLQNNQVLQYLNIKNNNLTSEAVEILEPVLCCTKLAELDISHNKLGDDAMDKFGQMLIPSMKTFSIGILNLMHNEITSKGAVGFLQGLEKNPNVWKMTQFSYIQNCLALNDTLKYINLQSCKICEQGGIAIGQGLMNNQVLDTLILANNFLNVKGILAIAGALKNGCRMRTLDLSRTGVEEIGAIELAGALEQNRQLVWIDLSQNLINEKAGFYILQMIKKNSVITYLCLDKNLVRYEQFCEINGLVQKNILKQKEKCKPSLLRQLNELEQGDYNEKVIIDRKKELETTGLTIHSTIDQLEIKFQQLKLDCEQQYQHLERQFSHVQHQYQKLNKDAHEIEERNKHESDLLKNDINKIESQLEIVEKEARYLESQVAKKNEEFNKKKQRQFQHLDDLKIEFIQQQKVVQETEKKMQQQERNVELQTKKIIEVMHSNNKQLKLSTAGSTKTLIDNNSQKQIQQPSKFSPKKQQDQANKGFKSQKQGNEQGKSRSKSPQKKL